jgi:hypothetical protein
MAFDYFLATSVLAVYLLFFLENVLCWEPISFPTLIEIPAKKIKDQLSDDEDENSDATVSHEQVRECCIKGKTEAIHGQSSSSADDIACR